VRLLLVDDHLDTLQGVTLALEASGATVTAASSARQALAEVQLRAPDVVVSDIGMPEMDGHDLLRTVRRLPDEDGGRTPAIALSAYVSAEDRLQALAAGYQEQLPKPVDVHNLVATIVRLVGEARSGELTVARPAPPVPEVEARSAVGPSSPTRHT
jgi:CheY-like chemotaxis protein